MQDENGDNAANGQSGDMPAQGAEAPATTDAQERIAALELANAALKEQALRALAEADNTRKRAERESAIARDYAIERFAADLLSVADNLSRASAALPADAREGASEGLRNLLAGVELTERELMRVFERHRIAPINPKGEPFDPNQHEAVAQIPSDLPAGRVAEVMQTGFRLGDRVLRAAMVAVSAGPATATRPGAAPITDMKV